MREEIHFIIASKYAHRSPTQEIEVRDGVFWGFQDRRLWHTFQELLSPCRKLMITHDYTTHHIIILYIDFYNSHTCIPI